MENKGLKEGIVDKIKTDPILYGKVAEALGVSPTSLPRILYANDEKLTQVKVLRVLREHLDAQDSELLPEMQEA